MRTHRLLVYFLTSLIALLFLPRLGFAQGNLGAITGTIQDSTGAAVPSAALTITNVDNGLKWTATTSSAGYYRVPLPPGTYQLQAEKSGFKKGIADKIVVPVAQIVTVDLSLQIGQVTETVEVTSQAPLLTPSTAEVSSAISPKEFEILPIEVDDGGRDLQTFIFKSLPGTIGDSWSGSINGGQLFSHEILIDGVTIGRYDLSGGGLTEFSPGTDAIGEFKVQKSNYSAEYGETGGGIANFSYKSGTNEFHGTLFEYNKNPHFNAAGMEVNSFPGTPKDNVKENDFGGTIGGPIRKEHTFFFFSYEGDRYRDFSFAGQNTLPTAAMRGGDFSSLLAGESPIGTDALGRPVYRYEIYDPTTTRNVTAGQVDPVSGLTANADATIRDPFNSGGQLNVIPSGQFSKASSVLLPLFPNPLLSGNFRNAPYFSGCCPWLDRDAYTAKIDHVLTSKQKIWGSFNWNARDRYNRGGHTFPPFPGEPINPIKKQDVGGPQVRIAHSWAINDHTVNEASIGFNRFYNKNGLSNDAKYTSQLGIPGIPNDCFPSIQVKSAYIPSMPTRFGQSCANIDPSESYVVQDIYSFLHGRHNVKIGGEFRRYRYNTFEPGPQSGSFLFADRETGLPGFTKSTGNPYASFIMGAVQSGSRSVYFTEPGYRSGIYAFFAQDDFKVSPKLTLNLGLRWEIPVPQTEVLDRESGFSPTLQNPGADNILGALEFLGNCSTCNHRHSFEDWYFKEVAPRLGVAYQITPNLVFRGGYGISYGPPIEGNFGSLNTWGFNDAVNLNRRPVDPTTYWSPLTSASLPANARIGVPAYTGTLPNRDRAFANGQTLDFLPRNGAAQPYVQNWSAGFQYLFPHQILFEADYMGSKGTRLLNGYFGTLYNQAPSKYLGLGDYLAQDLACGLANGIGPNCDPADPTTYPNSAQILGQYGITGLPYADFEDNNYDTSVAAAIQPYPQYAGLQNNYPKLGSSTYHSLQLLGRKTSTHGLTFIAAYTFSKLLTDSDSALWQSGSEVVQDFYNQKAEKAIASYDHTHVFKLTWVYQLPFGRGQRWLNSGGPFDRLVSGWQVTAIQNYQSGDPLVVTSALGTGFINSTYGIGGGLRADIVPGVPLTVPMHGLDVINGTQYLNPAAFADPPASDQNAFALRYGNAPAFLPRTRGPFQVIGENFGIVKDTKLSERLGLQFRADMFNVFNRTGKGDPDTCLCDGLPADGGTFGLITGPWNGPRIIQFALRLSF
jgi:hypothetical protein